MLNGDYFFRESDGRQTLCQFVCVQASDAPPRLDIQKISRSKTLSQRASVSESQVRTEVAGAKANACGSRRHDSALATTRTSRNAELRFCAFAILPAGSRRRQERTNRLVAEPFAEETDASSGRETVADGRRTGREAVGRPSTGVLINPFKS